MVLASCKPRRFQGSVVLGGNILSGAAFSAGPGYTLCCVVRERRVGQDCVSHLGWENVHPIFCWMLAW